MNTNKNLMSSSSLDGEDVKNREGEDLGNIKDFGKDDLSCSTQFQSAI